MSETELIIPRAPVLDRSEDYAFLRKEGLKYIEKLSSKFWTDYNNHDPGITIEELMCYAITDLGYRTSFTVPDLLAPDPDAPEDDLINFFTAREILPVNPVSETDLRKMILDIPGVKNVWLRVATDCEQPVYIDRKNCGLTLDHVKATNVLPVNGLYNVLIQYENDNAKKQEYDDILVNVRKRLMETRNLCEDYLSVTAVQYEDIAICSDIEVRPDADIKIVAAKIYRILIDYFSPPVNFHTLEEMLDKGKSIDEIFEGPALNSGFIETEELERNDLRSVLHTSDLYNLIADIKEVVAIRSLKLIRYVNGEPDATEEEWELTLGTFRSARLEIDKSKIIFYKGILPYMANRDDVKDELKQMQLTTGSFRKKGHRKDLDIPQGRFRNITDYYPVQNEFPLVYGIGTDGLPKNSSAERKAQALQLKAYLLFFEQMLTDYLAQLSSIKKLFTYKHTVDRVKTEALRMKIVTYTQEQINNLSREDFGIQGRTYYSQELTEIDGLDAVDGNPALGLLRNFANYGKDLADISESKQTFTKRRNRFLDHLLARFCEDVNDYGLTLFQMNSSLPENDLLSGLRLIHDKESLLLDYPKSSANRGKAFNYKPEKDINPNDPFDVGRWNSINIAGMKNRVARLTGMAGDQLDSLALNGLHVSKAALYTVNLHNKSTTSNRMVREVLLHSVPPFTKHIDADHFAELLLVAAKETGSMVKASSGGKFNFKLIAVADNKTLAASPEYDTEAKRNKAFDSARKLFDDGVAFKYMSIKEDAAYTVTLKDKNGTELMHGASSFEKKYEAEAHVQKFLSAAKIDSNFKKTGANPYRFALIDSCNNNELLAESRAFTDPASRDAMLNTTLQLFTDSRQFDVIRRRTLATELLDIHTSGTGVDQVWWVELADPDNPDRYLLKSRIDDTRECAESILLYILHNGDNPTIYKTEKFAENKYGFVMYDECGNIIASSHPDRYGPESAAQQQIDCVVRFFAEHCDVENFHLVEHLLLRPRTHLDQLVPACINCSASPGDKRPAEVIKPSYFVEVYHVKEKTITGNDKYAKRKRDILKSQLSLKQVKAGQIPDTDVWGFMVNDKQGHPILYSEGYIGLNGCTNGIASMRENGVNTFIDVPGVMRYDSTEYDECFGNYRIFKRKDNFHFHLYADNAQVIASSAVAYNTAGEALSAVRDLVKWLAFENAVIPQDAEPGHDEDPYSFRISVILPAWPSRFRNQPFRNYVEKVIRRETPAHIYPRVCWVNLQEMRRFEFQYKRWLQTLSENEIPNPNTTAEFIDVLFSLNNVYPTAVLHSCEDVQSDEPQVILDNTMLGTL